MLFACGKGVICEMIDNQGGPFRGEGNIEFKEQGGNGGWGRGVGGKAQEDVALLVDELEEVCGR